MNIIDIENLMVSKLDKDILTEAGLNHNQRRKVAELKANGATPEEVEEYLNNSTMGDAKKDLIRKKFAKPEETKEQEIEDTTDESAETSEAESAEQETEVVEDKEEKPAVVDISNVTQEQKDEIIRQYLAQQKSSEEVEAEVSDEPTEPTDTTTQTEPTTDTQVEGEKPTESTEPTGKSAEQAQYDFSMEWAKIKQEVKSIQGEYKTKILPAAKPYAQSNPKIGSAIQKVGSVLAAIGAVAGIAGTIASFIDPVTGAALLAGGKLLGGVGTLANRGVASVNDFKSGNVKGGLANLGMAAVGGLTAASGVSDVKGFANKSSQIVSTPANEVAQNVGAEQVAQATPEAPVFDPKEAFNKEIAARGHEDGWFNDPAIRAKYTPDEMNQMLNAVNNSAAGKAQLSNMANLNTAQSQVASSQNALNNAQDKLNNTNAFQRAFKTKGYTDAVNGVEKAASDLAYNNANVANARASINKGVGRI